MRPAAILLVAAGFLPPAAAGQARPHATDGPGELAAQLAGQAVRLTWTGLAGNPGFLVFRAIAPNPAFMLVTPRPIVASVYLDRGIVPSPLGPTTVVYRVQTAGQAGDGTSASITIPPSPGSPGAPAPQRGTQVDLPVTLSTSADGVGSEFTGTNLDIQVAVPAPFPAGATVEVSNVAQPSRSIPPTALVWNGRVYFHRYPIGNASGLSIDVTVRAVDPAHIVHLGHAHFAN